MQKIAIIGSGPMALYALKHLFNTESPVEIAIFEASSVAGVGMPYQPAMNADYMLCNAFSREIPSVTRPLLSWLKDRPKRELSEWELSRHDLAARAFYPRVLIGEYLQAEFEALCEKAAAKGHTVTVHTDCKVTNIEVQDGKPALYVGGQQRGANWIFDDVIIASGHSWPTSPAIDDVDLVSPWPYTNITSLKAGDIGILGSSLSAIDIVVALGHAHGTFDETGDQVTWLPADGSEALRVTMVSHLGIMPEGDFYYPFPYEPLQHLTDEAVGKEVGKGPDGLLDRVFALLCAELDACDPEYLASFAPSAKTVEGFAPAYFERRRELGGLRAVKRDLAQVRESLEQKHTIAHRYALLRGHAVFDLALRELSESDYSRFLEHLMPVFGDCYAAVPHLSLARVIALYDAGVLELLATGEDSSFAKRSDGSIEVETEDGPITFDTMIDARGQSPSKVADLPFPSLVASVDDGDAALLRPFELNVNGLNAGRVFCLALPQLLERHPFAQGLVECHELAGIAVRQIARHANK
ncbi:FAD/NAD(P)-binding protein [Erythrobacter sp. R86502]|uniref:FAD/NAD(P)-binding protein n=1 Tax=Erythrobacter sp. R86502 TaxID=3093846 RepID=UPI0036D312E4